MRTVAVLALAVGLGFVLGGAADGRVPQPDKKKGGKLEAAKLAGTWSFVSATKDGEKLPADSLKDLKFVVAKDEMTLKTPDGDFKFSYKIDSAATPASIDLEITDGPVGKGSKSKGIVALDGDTLKLAYHAMDGDRPKDFDAKKGSGVHSYTMKKAAGKKDKK
jgi:uncharacterized protein (TIGR03067 family)